MIIVLTLEAASTSETSANLYQPTRPYYPKDSSLHARRRENLIPHLYIFSSDKQKNESRFFY
jgi:hypothetical protein